MDNDEHNAPSNAETEHRQPGQQRCTPNFTDRLEVHDMCRRSQSDTKSVIDVHSDPLFSRVPTRWSSPPFKRCREVDLITGPEPDDLMPLLLLNGGAFAPKLHVAS